MSLRDDKMGQTLLVPTNLRSLIPDDHICFTVIKVVKSVDISEHNKHYRHCPGMPAYRLDVLLRLVLMGTVDNIRSGRELVNRAKTDIVYMYLAGMEIPDFRTINRFKKDHKELFAEALAKLNIMARKAGYIKLGHLAVDGTSGKANASMNNVSDKELLSLVQEIIEDQISIDEEEDREYGEKSPFQANNILKDIVIDEAINETLKNKKDYSKSRKIKLNRSTKNLLKKAEKSKENTLKTYKDIIKAEKELNTTKQENINLTDPESRLRLNKKHQYEFGYNIQNIVDQENQMVLNTLATNNPTDHHDLIPLLNEVEEIYGPIPPKTEISMDYGYFTNENTDYLEQKEYNAYIATKQLSQKLNTNKENLNPVSKDKFIFNTKIKTYICPLGQILEKRNEYTYNNKPRITYYSSQCKYCTIQKECSNNNNTRTITDYGQPSKIRMIRKMEQKESIKIYKKRMPTVEPVFGDYKQNMKFQGFYTRGIENIQTETYLLALSHNLKIYHKKKLQENQTITTIKQNT